MQNVLQTYGMLVVEERAILKELNADDVVTADILTQILVEQEKAIWMLTAMLAK